MSSTEREVRLYGNWRRPDSRGLKGLGTIGLHGVRVLSGVHWLLAGTITIRITACVP